MNDHQQITAERGRRAADLRAAVALLEQQSIAAGVMLDLDSDQVVAAGPKSAILYLLSNGAPAATSGDAPADLQQLKALALAADQGEGQHIYTDPRDSNGWKANEAWHRAASPAVVLGLIARIERLTEVADELESFYRDALGNRHSDLARGERAASGATASRDELPPLPKTGEQFPNFEQFTGNEMRAYARAAVSAATKPTADLSSLTRYAPTDSTRHYADFPPGPMCERVAGDYVKLADVQSLLATKPAAAPAVPEAFVVVPKLPTRSMIAKTIDAVFDGAIEDASVIEEVYAAMIAATPAASTIGAAQTAGDTKLLDALGHASWGLEAFNMPTGGDDNEIGWRVIEYHMAAPHRRTVAEVYEDSPRAAIKAAIKRPTTTQNSEAGDADQT